MKTFILWLTIVVPSYLYSGFVFSRLWAWFIVPVFRLPFLTVTQAVGVQIVIGFLVASYPKDEFKIENGQLVNVSGLDTMIKQVMWSFLYTSIISGIGFGLHRWMLHN